MLSNSKDRTFSLLLRLKPVLTVSLLQGRNAHNLVTIWEFFLPIKSRKVRSLTCNY
ncbi:hypothetical protein Lalb_Chr00c21g0406011 (mitochondrion) [Lupinus albus]|uniref:Uncharacterized protein n=1 Tax=Lupinus albus TaxID=3870 RepID=A0A6A4N1R6_LUPAL|nr:hypothetical protein Lalb_Chr00c21g0406011 [Lupinus albus]